MKPFSTMVKWDESYTVGSDRMDKQHQQLFGLMHALQQYKSITDKRFLGKMLHTLREYIVIHFKEEESLMQKVKFPDIDAHVKQHRLFAERIDRFEVDFKNGKEMTEELMEFLNHWLANHILVFDKAYEKYLRESSKVA